MKDSTKIIRHTITPRTPEHFIFLGIVSTEPDYRLSVMLNRQLGISLQHSGEEIIQGESSGAHHYSVFITTPETVSLVSNKSSGNILIRKLRNIDFIMVIHGAPDKVKAETLAASIRKNPAVTAVFCFDSREISDRNLGLLMH